MKIKRHYFESGKFAGWLIFWANYRYRTYIHREYGWRGKWPKGIRRFDWNERAAGRPWWHSGWLMLWDSRICWDTKLWITGPESYTVTREEVADNLYNTKKD